jgi:hypothetical protein
MTKVTDWDGVLRTTRTTTPGSACSMDLVHSPAHCRDLDTG